MGVWKDRSRGDWCYDFLLMGKRYAGRGFKTKAAARSGREDRRKSVLSQEPRPKIQGTVFRDAAYAYLDYARLRFSAKTYDSKQRVLKRFHQFLGNNFLLSAIETSDCHKYLFQATQSNNSWNVYRKDMVSFFNWCRTHFSMAANPAVAIDRMPHAPSVKKLPTEEEIIRMISACTDEQRPLFLAILHTLGRVDEVLRLTWADIDFERRIVLLKTKKRHGGSYETDPMPMNQDLYDVLFKLSLRKEHPQLVISNPKTGTRYVRRPKMMAGICRRAGIQPIGKGSRMIRKKRREVGLYYGFHSLRHFMASYLNKNSDVGMKGLQRLLRHKSQRTTEIYLHEIDSASRTAIESVEGRFSVVKPVVDCLQSDDKKQQPAESDVE